MGTVGRGIGAAILIFAGMPAPAAVANPKTLGEENG